MKTLSHKIVCLAISLVCLSTMAVAEVDSTSAVNGVNNNNAAVSNTPATTTPSQPNICGSRLCMPTTVPTTAPTEVHK